MSNRQCNLKTFEEVNAMGFSSSVADEVLVRCGRHYCLCGKYVGQKIELHHIKQVAD